MPQPTRVTLTSRTTTASRRTAPPTSGSTTVSLPAVSRAPKLKPLGLFDDPSGDGLIDLRKDTTLFTVSNNVFRGHDKNFGIGSF